MAIGMDRVRAMARMPVGEAARRVFGRLVRGPVLMVLPLGVGPKLLHKYGSFDLKKLAGADYFEIEITDSDGLHARPSGAISVCATKFSAAIELVLATEDKTVCRIANAKKSLDILSLNNETGMPAGSKILIYARGEDQRAAIGALEDLIVAPATEKMDRIGRILNSTTGRAAMAAHPSYHIETQLPAAPKISMGHALVCDEVLNVERYAAFKLNDDPRFLSGAMTIDGLVAEKVDVVSDAFDKLLEVFRAGGEMTAALIPQLMECRAGVTAIMAEQKVNSSMAVQLFLEAKKGLRHSPDEKKRTDYWSMYKLLAKMLNYAHQDIRDINAEVDRLGQDQVMVVCEDLAETDIKLLDNMRIRGLLRKRGSRVDHISIAARGRELVSWYNLGDGLDRVQDGDFVVVDECEGRLVVNPDAKELAKLRAKKERLEALKGRLKEMRPVPLTTRDGQRFAALANVNYPDEIKRVNDHGLDGVGLVRTEYFYAIGADSGKRSEAPALEDQIRFHQALIEQSGGRRVVIRTIDPEKDKMMPYFKPLYGEDEIFGTAERKRGIAVCLDSEKYPDYHALFLEQVSAILQTSGAVDVMFPMVRAVDEFGRTLALIEQTRARLAARGIRVNNQIRYGVMVEHPDILKDLPALLADARLAFISFGTSDLTEEITGVKRTSSALSGSFDEKDPRVLAFIQTVTERAKAGGKEVSVCGDLANDWRALLWLWGIGIETTSLSTGIVDLAKKIASAINLGDLKELVRQVSYASTPQEVRRVIEHYTREKIESGEWGELSDFVPLLFPRETPATLT